MRHSCHLMLSAQAAAMRQWALARPPSVHELERELITVASIIAAVVRRRSDVYPRVVL